MSECICSSCKNLKGLMNEDGAVEQYECELGFPSTDCDDCDGSGCELTCENYISDEEDAEPIMINCSGCGKELKQICSGAEDGDVYCVECYLSKK